MFLLGVLAARPGSSACIQISHSALDWPATCVHGVGGVLESWTFASCFRWHNRIARWLLSVATTLHAQM